MPRIPKVIKELSRDLDTIADVFRRHDLITQDLIEECTVGDADGTHHVTGGLVREGDEKLSTDQVIRALAILCASERLQFVPADAEHQGLGRFWRLIEALEKNPPTEACAEGGCGDHCEKALELRQNLTESFHLTDEMIDLGVRLRGAGIPARSVWEAVWAISGKPDNVAPSEILLLQGESPG